MQCYTHMPLNVERHKRWTMVVFSFFSFIYIYIYSLCRYTPLLSLNFLSMEQKVFGRSVVNGCHEMDLGVTISVCKWCFMESW